MRQGRRSKAARGKHKGRSAAAHPHSIATIVPPPELDETPDQPFAEGANDQLDGDLRHRLISEAAFHHQAERGYDEGYDREDWLDAEAEVDHVVVGPKPA